MTINYGKRYAGGLTAADPGDTLHIPFATYNDSGASIAPTGLAVTDIEIYKNGGIVQRATDSGYAVAATFDSITGLNTIQVSLYNTADDTGFFDAGSSYMVAISSITVDARTVNLWPAVFEIDGVRTGGPNLGLQQVEIVDTGLRTLLADYDTGIRSHIDHSDTGIKSIIAQEGTDTGLRQLIDDYDTGMRSTVAQNGTDTGLRAFIDDIDTGLRGHSDHSDTGVKAVVNALTLSVDTGQVNQAVWQGDATRVLTAGTNLDFGVHDTGLRQLIDDYDTGMRSHSDHSDTGVKADIAVLPALAAIVDAVWDEEDTGHQVVGTFGFRQNDTGEVANAVWAKATRTLTAGTNLDFGVHDTGMRALLAEHDTGVKADIAGIPATIDTGVVNQAVWQADASRTLSSFDVDTGLRALIADIDTGLRGQITQNATDTGLRAYVTSAVTDTGLRTYLDNIDTGLRAFIDNVDTGLHGNVFSVNVIQIDSDTGVVDNLADAFADTGKIDVNATATLDTGVVNQAVWQADALRLITNIDTGAALHLAQLADEHDTGRLQAEATATLDTGAVNQAVWNADASRLLTGSTNIDTGIADAAWGTNARKVIAHRMVDEYDTGRLPAEATATLDTGAVNQAVWTADGARVLTAGTNLDFGVHDTGLRTLLADLDTGTRSHMDHSDTGVKADIAAISVSIDTGQVNQAVWVGDAARVLTAGTNLDFGVHDTGLRTLLADYDTGMRGHSDHSDTGVKSIISQHGTDTGLRQLIDDYDTGLRSHIDHSDTGIKSLISDTGQIADAVDAKRTLIADTGKIGNAVWAIATRTLTAGTNLDFGVHDTGLRTLLADLDTGMRAELTDLDTGIKSRFDNMAEDTGGVNVTALNGDTGITARFFAWSGNLTDSGTFDTGMGQLTQAAASIDTGQVNQAVWAADATRVLTAGTNLDFGVHDTGLRTLLADYDTGARSQRTQHATDTGLRALLADYDTGVRSHIDHADTGLKTVPAAIQAKTDSLTFTVAGMADANIQAVNDVTVGGTGDTGAGDTWGPA